LPPEAAAYLRAPGAAPALELEGKVVEAREAVPLSVG
jgi:hypothetical protein